MVMWSELVAAISTNPYRSHNVGVILLRDTKDIERFALPLGAVKIDLPEPATTVVGAERVTAAPVLETKVHKEPFTLKQVIDPIILGVEALDPLYHLATHRSKRVIEIEQAQKLESQQDDLYKRCGGRSRGWIKGTLDAMIKPRCASGGDLYEIDRAKKTFAWALHAEDKCMSAFLDFICLARRIRCAVWHADTKTIYVYPAADMPADPDDTVKPIPLHHVDSTGHPRHGMANARDLIAHADREGWKLLPPHSVLHTLSGLKLDELESVGKKLGMAEVVGSKAARVQAIAEYKLRQRLDHVS